MNAIGKEQEGRLNREFLYLQELIYLSGKEHREMRKKSRTGFLFSAKAFVPSWNFKLISCITLTKIKIKFK